jgi:hypothetical protein
MRFLKPAKLLLLSFSILLLPCLTPAYVSSSPLSFQSEMGRMVTGNFDNPVTLEQINGLKAVVENDGAARSESKFSGNKPKPVLRLPSENEGEIVAFGYFIRENGIPSQYVAIAANEESVSSALQHATAWYNGELKKTYLPEYSARGAEWEQIGQFGDSFDAYPYGSVQNAYYLHYLTGDGDNDFDWFAIDHVFWMEPGCYAWSTDWENEQGWSFHDYSSGGSTDELFSRSPLGSSGPDNDLDVSITGGSGLSASLTWSFDLNVSIRDQSSGVWEYAKWNLYNINMGQRNVSQGMEPGSVVQVFQPDPDYTIILCDLVSTGQFEEQWTLDTVDVEYPITIEVEY